MPGSGKSTVGQQLAKTLQCEFCDLDQLIENQKQKSISEIFAENGEDFFRELESQALQEIVSTPITAVISTGGGIVMSQKNRQLLSLQKYVIYLQTTAEIIFERCAQDNRRPLLQNDNPQQTINNLYTIRHPLYLEVAKKTIDTNLYRPPKAVEIIIAWLENIAGN